MSAWPAATIRPSGRLAQYLALKFKSSGAMTTTTTTNGMAPEKDSQGVELFVPPLISGVIYGKIAPRPVPRGHLYAVAGT